MHPDDQEKMAFVTEWGVFVVVVMMFRLKMTSTTFQRIFDDYIVGFMQVILDNFAIYGREIENLD
mgnify:CR=1 FL=1